MREHWQCRTRHGTFSIRPFNDGWSPYFEDENLGWYHSPNSALDDLVGGHTISPSSGVDTADCGLPDELSEWTLVRRPG